MYANYAITVKKPDEQKTFSMKEQWALQRGLVKPEEQLAWLIAFHKQWANFKDRQDVAFHNALQMCFYIVTGEDPEYIKTSDAGAGRPKEPEPEVKPVEVEPDRRKVIKDAVRDIIASGKDENLTKAGIPAVAAIEALLGYDITSAERDEAFKKIKENA